MIFIIPGMSTYLQVVLIPRLIRDRVEELVNCRRCPHVQPDNGIVERLSRCFVPYDCRFSLICHSHSDNVLKEIRFNWISWEKR